MQTLSIIGVGLIGGSVGLAARQSKMIGRIKGAGRSPEALERALAAGTVHETTLDAIEAVRDADLVILCIPVDQIAPAVLHIAPHCRPGTVITDTGSTKAAIVSAVEGMMPANLHFVGGHPLAGSEKSGVEHADASLFQDRVTVLTRTPSTDSAALQKVTEFWRALGARIRIMTPEDHDRAVALTSHLPHLLASTLAGMLSNELFDLAASGFRDTTRIAAGDPSIWMPILSQNRAAVSNTLVTLRARLDLFRRALDNDDVAKLTELLAEGKRSRDALGS